jgi:GT2 family glycosyltransferase
MKIALCYNSPEMAEQLQAQLPSVFIVDAGSNPPLKDAFMALSTNKYWVNNWHSVLEYLHGNLKKRFIWLLNDDVKGVSEEMYQALLSKMQETNAFMITPAFNSPHSVFHKQGNDLREVNWVDMTAPLIDLDKYFELGGFDLNFKGYFADVDLCYRARQKGFKMYVLDSFEFEHIGGYTVNKEGMSEQSNMAHNQILIDKYGKSWNELI